MIVSYVCDRSSDVSGDDGFDGIRMCCCYSNRIRGPVWTKRGDVALSLWLCAQVLQQNDDSRGVFLLDILCVLASHSHLCLCSRLPFYHLTKY